MAQKEPRSQAQKVRRSDGVQKHRKGFNVGPALPEGPQKRRVQQLKRGLIENAKLKKQYAKLKRAPAQGSARTPAIHQHDEDVPPLGDSGPSPPPFNEEPPPQESLEDVSEVDWSDEDEDEDKVNENIAVEANEANVRRPHAVKTEERQSKEQSHGVSSTRERYRKPKPQPFQREERQAAQRRREADERREARERAERERREKLEERDRFRKAMAKARTGGKNGQRKLGRESSVLLEKVQRMLS